MKKSNLLTISLVLLIGIMISCSKTDLSMLSTPSNTGGNTQTNNPAAMTVVDPYAAIKLTFGTNIDPLNLLNYANQAIPNYINKDNTADGNQIADKIATLGRVLFYDKKLYRIFFKNNHYLERRKFFLVFIYFNPSTKIFFRDLLLEF